MAGKIFDASKAAELDTQERARLLPLAEVVAALHPFETDVIADIGAGTGYFAIPLAKAAARGKIYAIDAQPGMLEILKGKAAGIENIHLVHASAIMTTLETNSCDFAFYANVWHEFEHRDKVIEEARRILKSAGRIVVLDWRPDVERISGPSLNRRIGSSEVGAELTSAGFKVISSQNIGRYSWLVQAKSENEEEAFSLGKNSLCQGDDCGSGHRKTLVELHTENCGRRAYFSAPQAHPVFAIFRHQPTLFPCGIHLRAGS
jgi:ubiquinone/menaquinone biosynthesis C-methylase UbiE